MSVGTFRFLLLASWIGALGAGVLSGAIPELLPKELADYQEASLATELPWEPWSSIIALMVFLAMLAGVVGMFLLYRWGRTLSLTTTILNYAYYPLVGPVVDAWPIAMLSGISDVLWGAVLALAYFGPVSGQFRPLAASRTADSAPGPVD